jgi:GT2 family glycosyltransferase
MKEISISIIIINYNTSALTINCIESIIEFESDKIKEFIIVDNASREEDYDNLTKKLNKIDNITFIRSKINLGFAAGNMLGFQNATGNYYAFINSDVLFVSPVFEDMSAFMEKNKTVGVCGPQILNDISEESISFRPFEGLRYKLFGKKFLAFTQPNKPSMLKKYNTPIAVDFIIGSFMFFRAEAFHLVGGFDPNTFLYYEESDICFRLKKIGYSTYFLPNLKYIHLEGKSSSVNLNLKLEHLISYLYVTRKNLGFLKYIIIKKFLILSYLLKAPFKKKNRFLFLKLITMQESLAHSMRHNQKIN